MVISILLLCLFGIINLSLGVSWNYERFRIAGKYSMKYKAIWIIGIIEISAAIICLTFAPSNFSF